MNFEKTILYLNSKPGRISSHVLFWIAYIVIITFFGTIQSTLSTKAILFQIAAFQPMLMGVTYLTLYVYLPVFLFRKRYILFLALNLVTMVAVMFLDRVITFYYIIPTYFPEYMKDQTFFRFSYFGTIISIYFVIATAITLKLVKYWFLDQQKKNELEKQSLISELALLRSQINPHFLFNTLNNIEGLISIDAHKASDSLIRLSSILRYVLYDSSTERVPLEKEIGFLHDFIELQSLRMISQGFLSFEVMGNPNGVFIAPMLLVPLVENAVKHGEKNVSPPGIIISLNILPGEIDFRVSNHVNSFQKNKDGTGGIGLRNLNRRLDLLYPGRYSFVSANRDGMFLTSLSLRLT